MILLRAAERKGKKRRLSHTAFGTEMLALSLEHSSVNSLLGPLAQRGVQGCREINQQLTSHSLRSCMRDMNSPEQTLFNSQVDNPREMLGVTDGR